MMEESPSQEHVAEHGGGGGVKRRPLHHQHHQQQSPLPHHESGCAASLGGAPDKKRATSRLERSILVLFTRLFHPQSSSTRSRLLAWSILATLMLMPIVIFHTLPRSSSISSLSSLSISWWPLGHTVENNRTIVESRGGALYGRHCRAVQLDDTDKGGNAGHVIRLETFRYIDHQSRGNTDEKIITATSSRAALQEFDLQNITEPRVFRATAVLEEEAEEGTPIISSNDKKNANNNNNDKNARRRDYRLVQPMIAKEKVEALQDSSAYYDAQPDNWETKRCRAQFAWQKATYMTCNIHHELDMTIFSSNILQRQLERDEHNNESLRLVANGYYRDVWVLTNDHYDNDVTGMISSSSNATNNGSDKNKIVLKTLRYEHEFDLRNWDRHRRDAIAMERLTSSRFVLDIYASCGNSGLTEYAPGGSIKNALFPRRPRRTKQQQRQEKDRQPQHLEEPRKPSKIERLQMGA
jgi:hypothetical protein